VTSNTLFPTFPYNSLSGNLEGNGLWKSPSHQAAGCPLAGLMANGRKGKSLRAQTSRRRKDRQLLQPHPRFAGTAVTCSGNNRLTTDTKLAC
jgi:hypothetical protein